jgi:transcriptional regulator with PAS, ATPase and Fis domain
MNQLKAIERNGQRVLTTEQLAELFESESSVLTRNFNRNKERYIEGKHYFVLTGDERREFLNQSQIDSSLKHAHTIYLWTEKGAFLHAKSLNTDKAWNAYSQLVDDYFKKVEEAKQALPDTAGLSPMLQMFIQVETNHNELKKSHNELSKTVADLTENLTVVPDHTKVVSVINEYARWTRLGHNEVYNKVYETLKNKHGIDVRQRVSNERERIQENYYNKTGKRYADSTLKSKTNGIDVMVQIGCLDKFYTILSGMLAKEKVKSKLSVIQ